MHELVETLLLMNKKKRDLIIENMSPDIRKALLSEFLGNLNPWAPAVGAVTKGTMAIPKAVAAANAPVKQGIGAAVSGLAAKYGGNAAIGAGIGAGVGASGAAGSWIRRRAQLSRKLSDCTTDTCKSQVRAEISALRKEALAKGIKLTLGGALAGGGLAAAGQNLAARPAVKGWVDAGKATIQNAMGGRGVSGGAH